MPAIAAYPELLDADGRIRGSLPCRACGYDLIGQPVSGRCPECGGPVEMSLRDTDDLAGSDPSYLASVVRGFTCVAVGLILMTFTIIGLAGMGGVVGAVTRGNIPPDFLNYMQIIGGAISAIPTILVVLGVWLITTPDPGQPGGAETSSMSCRSLVRTFALLYLVGNPIGMFLSHAASSGGLFQAISASLIGIISIAFWVMYFVWLRRFLYRLPTRPYRRQIRIIMVVYAISMFVSGSVGVVMMTTQVSMAPPATGPPSVRWIIGMLSIAVSSFGALLGILSTQVWAAVLHLNIRRRVKSLLT